MGRKPNTSEMFWDFARIPSDVISGCWEWTGPNLGGSDFNGKDYGTFKLDGIRHLAHRYAYELFHGKIQDGMVIRHESCANPSCVNPAHLKIGTALDNIVDRDRDGHHGYLRFPERWPRHESHNMAKLDWGKVDAIRERYALGCTQRELACDYGVTTSNISCIVNKKTWNKGD